jgi:hypothetical protein
MYTGTLINDLMAAADRVGQTFEHERMEEELHATFSMQIPVAVGEPAYLGAA